MRLVYLGIGSILATIAFANPFINLDDATVAGFEDGSVSKFLGIPYAQPPVGPLRLRRTQELTRYKGHVNATAYGPACPQQKINNPFDKSLSTFMELTSHQSEDCLTINVLRPSVMPAGKQLPVVVFIYGGGFQIGDTAGNDDLVTRIVKRSVELSQPIILAHMNYRLSALGFLGGKEVHNEDIGNLGLVDQRTALRWVQKYIGQFGGDKSKVTLWGQSAGATSIVMQMLAYGGATEDLFHAAFMQSGATLPFGSILDGQAHYDFIVEKTGCQGSMNTLDCLRGVDYHVFKEAMDATPNIFSYNVRDSVLILYSSVQMYDPLVLDPHVSASRRRYIRQVLLLSVRDSTLIFALSGNCDDEGTLFSFSTQNITTEDQFRTYIRDMWFPKVPSKELQPLWSLYTSNAKDGSPFDTDNRNALTPQFKRLASFQGDAIFHSQRRPFFNGLSGRQNIWSYLTKQLKSTEYFGSYHGSELKVNLTDDYLVNFVNHHNPNTAEAPFWPEYTAENPQLYTFPESGSPIITLDNFRAEPISFLSETFEKYPI
ncbi:hypothetical protein CVT26_009129 [Gymnopilus dilepis]|uniref:Carboxylic ester hydrolase n=1 Tax=Gymnopilus dilepis TaxID=231916 RepID=A0A409YRG5_9AGAR|nr:hypothetical protein CVT26_009129 [Gymnopilus dilepis]